MESLISLRILIVLDPGFGSALRDGFWRLIRNETLIFIYAVGVKTKVDKKNITGNFPSCSDPATFILFMTFA